MKQQTITFGRPRFWVMALLLVLMVVVTACAFGQEVAPAAETDTQTEAPAEAMTDEPAAPVEVTTTESPGSETEAETEAETSETLVETTEDATAETTESASDPTEDFLTTAEVAVVTASRPTQVWSGPIDGPVAAPSRLLIAFVAADLQDSRIGRVREGVIEAAETIGWQVQVLDGQGSEVGRTAALNQALTLPPAGIILVGFEATEQEAAGLNQAAVAGIPVVGWQVAAELGPMAGLPLFANVAGDSAEAAELVALYAVDQAEGEAGVVIFTDPTLSGAAAQTEAMAEVIEQCLDCTLLAVQEVPLAEASAQMPRMISSLEQAHGDSWTHSLAVNDGYFEAMGSALTASGPPHHLATGPGSEAAYQRIRESQFQVGTVPEPLILHGWQLIDELNRAFAGQAWSGYVPPAHLVTAANIEFDGLQNNVYEPNNGYREVYQSIWAGSEPVAGESDGEPVQP